MRDIPGPNPYEFGIVSKSKIVKPIRSILPKVEINNNDEKEREAELLKYTFFQEADKKAKFKQIKRTVDEIMNQRSFLLNDRRSKLKSLLLTEQKQYERELMASAVTPLQREAELREKARQIRANKENELAQFVQEKLDQKWRSECDELRTLRSKQLQSGMREEHLRQIEEKICKERHKLEEEAFFADLWYKDIEAKKQREDEQLKRSEHRNRETSQVLKEQMSVLERQKEDDRRQRIENARLMKEKLNIEKLEKQLTYQKKLEDQGTRRKELDNCVRIKLNNEARRAQEETSYDLKILEDSLISFQNEDEIKARRKLELLREQQHYQEYLRLQKEEEKQIEKELEKVIDKEVENQFEKRLNQWRSEKQARKALLENVIEERKLQIIDKETQRRDRQLEAERDKMEINRLAEIFKQEDAAKQEENKYKNKKYADDLLGQINYYNYEKNLVRNKLKDEKYQEYKNYTLSEEDYQRKLNDEINKLSATSALFRNNQSGFCIDCQQKFSN